MNSELFFLCVFNQKHGFIHLINSDMLDIVGKCRKLMEKNPFIKNNWLWIVVVSQIILFKILNQILKTNKI